MMNSFARACADRLSLLDLELFAEQEESEKDANQQLHSVEDPRSTNDSSNAPVAQRPNAEHFGLFDADGIERCYPNIGPSKASPLFPSPSPHDYDLDNPLIYREPP